MPSPFIPTGFKENTVGYWLLSACFCLLAACQPATPTPRPLPQSAWGSVITVAQAEQADAPAISVDENGLVAAWIGSDEQGVFQSLRTLNAQAMSDPVRLPLPVRPYAQQFAPALNNQRHLFWLDSNVEGETRLFTALLEPDLQRERESTIITKQVTRRYMLLPTADGGVWAVASGGFSSEPNLYAHFIDADGRLRLNENPLIAELADWPTALQRSDGLYTLYWLRNTDGMLMQAGFVDGQLANPQALVNGVILGPGDRIDAFTAAQDSTHLYFFWNLTRTDGRHETWLSSGSSDQATWPLPARVQITIPSMTAPDPSPENRFDSGFNAGAVFVASSGRDAVSWVKPASGTFAVLPVAAQVNNQLAVIFLRAGNIVGYRPLNIETKLIGMPSLAIDRDLYLYLAWSQPDPAGYANLQLTSLKFDSWAWLKNPPSS
jgi:hypothetical protein